MQNWFQDAVIYQMYPLGLVGAPYTQDGICVARIRELIVNGWLEHIQKLGANCLLLNPLFLSDTHGYDTADFMVVDPRLGSKQDLCEVIDAAHVLGLRVLFDAVLNHVGRSFWAFQDVLTNREASPYAGWFHIDFSCNNRFGDNLSYACWEGVDTLVTLNHANFELNQYLTDIVQSWVDTYAIDGLRLDVAYALDPGYLHYLRSVADDIAAAKGAEFVLVGECLHGDYNRWMGEELCHSVTNYEAYKGLWSSVNAHNMHEIAYSLNRQFGSDPWCLYTGRPLASFLDNHDTDRIATKLVDARTLGALWALLFAMPGVPAIYYGSEWGEPGQKLPGDHEIRPRIVAPKTNELTSTIAALARARKGSKALTRGSYKELCVAPDQLIFERTYEGEHVLFAINIADTPSTFETFGYTEVENLIDGSVYTLKDSLVIDPFGCVLLRKRVL